MKTETIQATIDSWTNEPDKALGAPVVTTRAEDSQAVIQAGPFTWRADLPPQRLEAGRHRRRRASTSLAQGRQHPLIGGGGAL